MEKQTKSSMLNVILLIITFFFLMSSVLNLYFNTLGKDKIPTAITSTYVTTVTDPQTNEELPFIEAQLYSNEAKNGKEMVEIKFNCYSGPDMQAIYARGFQMIDNKIYYYDTYDSVSFETGNAYKWGEPLLTEIDGELFGVALDGTYTDISAGKVLGNIFLGPAYWLATGSFYDVESQYNYTIKDFMNVIKRILRSNSEGTGESILPLVDMETYMGVYEANSEQKLSKEELGKRGISYSYFTVKANYSKSGVLWSEQSMFKIVAGKNDYNASNITNKKEYWTSNSVVNITEELFGTRETTEGKFLYLSTTTINEINMYSDIDVYVEINLDNLTNVIGFDYFALSNLNSIKAITITSSTASTFIVKNSAFDSTNFDIENIITENVVLSIEGGTT